MRVQSYSQFRQLTITAPHRPAYDTPELAVAAYNKRAKELGKPLTELDSKITAALIKKSSAVNARR